MDIFSWSVPFVTEKILAILVHIIKQKPGAEEVKETDTSAVPLDRGPPAEPRKLSKREILRNRVLFVGKMARMQKNLREENEALVRLRGLAPDNKIPRGILSSTSNEI
jgi:serine/threonine-protein phosphatase 2B catalytic subunit